MAEKIASGIKGIVEKIVVYQTLRAEAKIRQMKNAGYWW